MQFCDLFWIKIIPKLVLIFFLCVYFLLRFIIYEILKEMFPILDSDYYCMHETKCIQFLHGIIGIQTNEIVIILYRENMQEKNCTKRNFCLIYFHIIFWKYGETLLNSKFLLKNIYAVKKVMLERWKWCTSQCQKAIFSLMNPLCMQRNCAPLT